MALHATFDYAQAALRSTPKRRTAKKAREAHDLTLIFWSIATPACLLFWAAVAYGIHSAF